MRRRMMKSKIHRGTVTGADVHYVGSISLDPDLMTAADIREWEQVHVLDIDHRAARRVVHPPYRCRSAIRVASTAKVTSTRSQGRSTVRCDAGPDLSWHRIP